MKVISKGKGESIAKDRSAATTFKEKGGGRRPSSSISGKEKGRKKGGLVKRKKKEIGFLEGKKRGGNETPWRKKRDAAERGETVGSLVSKGWRK